MLNYSVRCRDSWRIDGERDGTPKRSGATQPHLLLVEIFYGMALDGFGQSHTYHIINNRTQAEHTHGSRQPSFQLCKIVYIHLLHPNRNTRGRAVCACSCACTPCAPPVRFNCGPHAHIRKYHPNHIHVSDSAGTFMHIFAVHVMIYA